MLDPYASQFGEGVRVFGPPPAGRLRVYLRAKVGGGKTHFCLSAPRSLVLDFENKALAIPYRGPGTSVYYFSAWERYEELLNRVIADGLAGRRYFDTVVFDPMPSVVSLVRASLTAQYRAMKYLDAHEDITNYGQKGSGWDIVNGKINRLLTDVYNAGYGWIATSHIMPVWKKGSDGRDTAVQDTVLNAGVERNLYKDADYTGIILNETDVTTTGGGVTGTQMIQGRPVSIRSPVKTEIRKRFTLGFLPSDPMIPVRVSVPLSTNPIDITDQHGMDLFHRVYDDSVTAFVASSRS